MKKLIILFALVVLFSLNQAGAQTYVAPGDGTLSQAILNAQSGDVLELVAEGVYTETTNNAFGTVVDKHLTIQVEGENPLPARVQLLSLASAENTPIFFLVGNNASIVLRDLEFDGSLNATPNSEYLIQFYMGEFPAPTLIKRIDIKNCFIHDFTGNVISAGNSDMRANLIVDSTFVDNCVIKNTGTSVYYKYAGANFISVTNSTFNTILSYGFRVAGPSESNMPDNTPSVVIDHTTWYNIGTTDGREIILCEKGPHQGQWTVSNSVLVKQIKKDKVVINIKETVTDDQARIFNVCLWDVGTVNWRNHPVGDTLTADPGFADPENGDFTLPVGSPLLTFASDGGAIGDPRWATNAASVLAANTGVPERFILAQNYPNPFNPATTITFNLKKSSQTKLAVYDLLGREIAVLVNAYLATGSYQMTFDARALASGIYLYQLKTAGQTVTKKMSLMK